MITREACVVVLEKVRAAMGALDELMLSDAWDAVPNSRQLIVAKALEAMRLDPSAWKRSGSPGCRSWDRWRFQGMRSHLLG